MTDDILDSFLRCGLYVGAIFQLVCIAAAVVIPEKSIDPITTLKDQDFSEDEGSDHSSPQATPRKPHTYYRPKKTEKKKRR